MSNFHFQYCQKIIVFSRDLQSLLLCRRKGEEDYNGIYSFIGGKMETTDDGFVDSLRREKNEEVGEDFIIKLYPTFTTNILFTKKDGNAMVLPHYYSVHQEGDIQLNEEYSDYKWVPVGDINAFEPKIASITSVITQFRLLTDVLPTMDFVLI